MGPEGQTERNCTEEWCEFAHLGRGCFPSERYQLPVAASVLPETVDHAPDRWSEPQPLRNLLAGPGQQKLEFAVTNFRSAQRREGVRPDKPLEAAFQGLALLDQAELSGRAAQQRTPPLRIAKVPSLQYSSQQTVLRRFRRFNAFAPCRPIIAIGAVLRIELRRERSRFANQGGA